MASTDTATRVLDNYVGGRCGRMIEMAEAACAVPTTMQGSIIEDVARNVDAETVRQPVGVCAAIVPFNFQAMVPFWFLPFAIAGGNTFVLKPSEQVPLTQSLVFGSLDELDLPPGVVNLVNGTPTGPTRSSSTRARRPSRAGGSRVAGPDGIS